MIVGRATTSSDRLEALTRGLATESSRHRLLRGISASVLGGRAAAFHITETEAKIKDKPRSGKGTLHYHSLLL